MEYSMKDLSTHSENAAQRDAQVPSYLSEQHQKNSLFQGWYRIASPVEPQGENTFKERERFRRGRAGSQIIPALYILLIISLPAGFGGNNPNLAAIVGGGFTALTIATVCNRLGKVGAAGFIVVATFTAYPILNIVTTPGGLNMMILPLFGLLILPLLCAVSFLPVWWVFVVALGNSLFTLYALVSLPQTAELNAILTVNNGLVTIVTPIILSQIIVSTVAYIWVHSTMQALRRVDRAEEIARLEHDLALQAEFAAQQKQQLEASIQKIVATHTRVANGDLNARVPLTEDNVLWQVSGTLNNLLSRLQRMRQESADLQNMRLALMQSREENRRLTRLLEG
jgi:hypothetical protein